MLGYTSGLGEREPCWVYTTLCICRVYTTCVYTTLPYPGYTIPPSCPAIHHSRRCTLVCEEALGSVLGERHG